eukprot:NODE_610_length_6054_cov_0.409908.p2 type:complete len:486 gc:universal NODE_610_length_6054_cov_0.409908:1739-3196(+)
MRSLLRRLHIQNGSHVELQKDFKWLGSSVLNKLNIQKIHEPTQIQQYTWAFAKAERDMIAISKTGSGKTLGFLGGVKDKQALVLAPTRELVEQISCEYKKYFNGKVATIYGGASRYGQIRELSRNPSLIVATPGRLIDLMNEHHVPVKMDSMVLDEADRMLDMGFEPQLREIMRNIERKQTLMFSATWPKNIQKLASEFLDNHVHVSVGSMKLTLNKDVTHDIVHCRPVEKLGLLMEKLTKDKTIIFCNTKRMVDKLHQELIDNRVRSSYIHGDCSQAAREFALQKFKDGKSSVLVATDVCGRGIDVNDVKYVINYDIPNDGEDFIHRIGRTGRAGKSGVAISYFTSNDAEVSRELIKIFEDSDIEVPQEILKIASTLNVNSNRRKGHNNDRSRFNRENRFSDGTRPQNIRSNQQSNRSGAGYNTRFNISGGFERSTSRRGVQFMSNGRAEKSASVKPKYAKSGRSKFEPARNHSNSGKFVRKSY